MDGRRWRRSEADSRTDELHLPEDPGAEHVQRPETAIQSTVRTALADRGHRALHRPAGRLRAELRLGRLRGRPHPGRSLPLARQRGGRTPQRGAGCRGLLPRQLSGPHPGDGDRGHRHVLVLRARDLVPVPQGPGPARYHLVGDATAAAPRLRTRITPHLQDVVRHQHPRVLPPGIPSRPHGFHRAGGRLPRRVRRPPGPPRCRWCCTAGGRPRPR